MAGKQGEARGRAARLRGVIARLEAVLEREAQALEALPPSGEAAGVEKSGRAVKSLSDGARSLLSLADAVDDLDDLPASAAAPDGDPDTDEPEPPADPDDLRRRRERVVERYAVRFAVAERADPRDRPEDAEGAGGALAVPLERRPAPA